MTIEPEPAPPDLGGRGAYFRRRRRRLQGRGEMGSVLLALADADHPSTTLRQTDRLARSLDAELHVMRVLPPARHFTPFVSGFALAQAARRAERCLTAARDIERWCEDVLPERLRPERLGIRVGEFVGEAAGYADELDAPLLVVAPGPGRMARTVTALAHTSGRPVLVSRSPSLGGTILVATDLDDEDAVLRRAINVSAQLNARVVAVHHLSDSKMALAFDSPVLAVSSAIPGEPESEPGQARLDRLERLGARHQPLIATVVTHGADAAGAILDRARLHGAHTVVVGTRERTWLEHFIAPSVAVAMIDRSELSVLVIPLERRTP
jgi:nucleotide-binding universal stress UspA family protein